MLRGILARTVPAPTLARISFATQCTRHLDRSGYIRFRRWRFYAEAGLAKKDVQVSIYTVAWHEDNKHITEVSNPRVVETSYRSPQLTPWTRGPDEWLLFKKLPDYGPRSKRKHVDVIQLSFPDWNEDQQQTAFLS